MWEILSYHTSYRRSISVGRNPLLLLGCIWAQGGLLTCLCRSRVLERVVNHISPPITVQHNSHHSFSVQASVLVDHIRIRFSRSAMITLAIRGLPEQKMVNWLVVMPMNVPSEAKSTLPDGCRKLWGVAI